MTAGEWKVAKKAMVTRDKRIGGAIPRVSYPIVAADNIVIEFRVMLPPDTRFGIAGVAGDATPGCPVGSIDAVAGFICIYSASGGVHDLAVKPFPHRKARWLTVLYEMIGNKCALTVDGRTVEAEVTEPEIPKKVMVRFQLRAKRNEEILAIDDVKVWEALPKDEEDEKGKKKRR